MHPHRLVGTAVALLILTAALSACDPTEPNPENTPALAGPPKNAAHRAGAAAAVHRKMTRAQMLKALAAGPAKKRFAHIDIELRSRANTLTGRGDMAYSPTNPSFEMEVAGSCSCEGNIDVVVTKRRFYVHVPGVLPEGTYTRINPNSPDGLFVPSFARVSKELDPLSALLAMRPGFRKVRYTGRASMYGHDMSTYTLVVDSRVGLQARGRQLLADEPGRMVYHVWFDKHRMVSKLTVHWAGLRMKAEMSDWGKPVHIKPPRPRQLVGPGSLSKPRVT